jgi:hypothetical protein
MRRAEGPWRGSASLLIAIFLAVTFASVGTHAMTEGEQTYKGLRELALKISPEDFGLKLGDGITAYGVLMEFTLPKATVTLTSYSSGDASLYISSGGGILGGIGHEAVRNAARQFVSSAQTFLSKMKEIASFPLPPTGMTHFYVLTNHGLYGSAELISDDLRNPKSEFFALFAAGQDVITEIRKSETRKPAP